jgi:hypothetical protein
VQKGEGGLQLADQVLPLHGGPVRERLAGTGADPPSGQHQRVPSRKVDPGGGEGHLNPIAAPLEHPGFDDPRNLKAPGQSGNQGLSLPSNRGVGRKEIGEFQHA